MTKNCINCRHLEFMESEYFDESGFDCNKRCGLSEKKNAELLFNLSKEAYRQKSKACFEFKDDGSEEHFEDYPNKHE